MLELGGVRFAYPGGTPFIFDMAAAHGEITAITGRSGAGKSTLLDVIAGFATPASGHIRVDGDDITTSPPEGRPVAILFQSETLFDHLSVAANIALARRGRTPPETIEAALAEVGLPGLGERRASALSGGQRQRVALARTLLLGRPVLLLDEPFSALDDETRADLRTLLSDLTRRRNWITLLVSHHTDDIAALARVVYAVEDQRLVRR